MIRPGLVDELQAVVGAAVRSGSSPNALATSERSELSESQPSTRLLGQLVDDLAARERPEQPGELGGRPDGELRRVIRTAAVAHQVEQRRAQQPERLGARPHRRKTDLTQQHIGGEVVAGRPDETRQIGDRQRRSLEVLPDAAVADRVARGLVEDPVAREVAIGQPADTSINRRILPTLAVGSTILSSIATSVAPDLEVDHRRRDLRPLVGEGSEGGEGAGEGLHVLDGGMPRSPRRTGALASLSGGSRFYQMVTLSSGSSQRASLGATPKVE